MPPEALTGFMHGHKHLGYLLSLLPVIQVILVLAGGTKKPGLAKAVRLMAKMGYRIIGGLVMLMGFVLWFSLSYGVATGFIWITILLWGPIEVASKRLVVPQCDAVLSGGEGSSQMLLGSLIQLV